MRASRSCARLGDVLEREQKPGLAARRAQDERRSARARSRRRRRASARTRPAAGSGGLVRREQLARARRAAAAPRRSDGRPPRPRGNAGDRLGGTVEGQDPAVRSVVARPLGRLSMTCWLNACRSASRFDACSSRASARRSLSGQVPAQRRDREEAEHVQADAVERQPRRRQQSRGGGSRDAATGRSTARRTSAGVEHALRSRPSRRRGAIGRVLAAMIGSM